MGVAFSDPTPFRYKGNLIHFRHKLIVITITARWAVNLIIVKFS